MDNFIDDPMMILDKPLIEISNFLKENLDNKLKNAEEMNTGLILKGITDEGTRMCLEIKLSVEN